MYLRKITLLIFILSLTYSHAKKCKILNGVMDCSGLNFTDCPPGNKSIFTLILDNNLIINLSSNNCRNWTQLRSLSIRRNGLNNVPGFKHFPSLTKLDLSENQLREIEIHSSKNMEDINVSNNSIKTIIVNEAAILLKILRASHNQIDTNNLDKLIQSIFQSQQITNLDFSDNLVDSLPVNFMNFKPSQAWSLNLSGNQFTGFDFNMFQHSLNGFIRFDLSHNKIKNFSIDKTSIKIEQLNLNSNKLSKIDVCKLNKFEGLNQLDLLNNPLNCLCNESASFIQWMKEHAHILANAPKLKCGNPPNQFVLNVTCQSSSTTPVPTTRFTSKVPSTSTKIIKTSTTHHKTTNRNLPTNTQTPIVTTSYHPSPNVTNSTKKEMQGWKITVIVLAVIIIIVLTILSVLYLTNRRRGYRVLNSQDEFGARCPYFPCLGILTRQNTSQGNSSRC